MDEEAFGRYLRRRGKKPHVVEGLTRQVRRFEEHLARERRKGLDAADARDLRDYVAAMDALDSGSARKRVRGLALYYASTGNTAMASLAAGIREAEVASTRKAFALGGFRGVDPDHIARLSASGISNVEQMLEAGKTPEARRRLAEETGVPLDAVLELVKLSDLSRVEGLKGIRARLYHDAGADTLEKIARYEPEELRVMLADFVKRAKFRGIAPLPKEVRYTVARAKALPRIVEFE